MSSDQLNTFGYFYSTVAQSIAAIIALFGLFATFRIQYSNMQKEAALHSLRDYIKLKCFDGQDTRHSGYSYVDHDVQCWLDKDVPAHLREIILKGDVANRLVPGGFYDYYLFINSIESFTRHMIKRLVQYMITLGIFLIFNVLALQDLSGVTMQFWSNSFVVWFTIIFLIGVIGELIYYTRDSLKGPIFIPFNNNETNKLNSQDFSIFNIEKKIKQEMINRGLDQKIINAFKAYI